MIDIKLVRENPGILKENIKKRFQKEKLPLVEKAKKKDEEWRKLKLKADSLRADRNKISREISEAKKTKKPVSPLLKKAKKIPKEIEKTEEKTRKLQEEISEILKKIPNIINKSVPIGKDETKSKEIEKFGKKPKFAFPIKSHVELGESLNLLDFNSSAKTSGSGFYYMEGDLALLNRALIQFSIDKMTAEGFRYVETPLMLRNNVIENVTDIHDRENMIYKIENEDLHLIGTSEHSLIGRYIDSVLTEKNIPVKETSYSMCFRKEIGSHGIDEKGIFRTHQFNKAEMIVICRPEKSMKYFEKMKNISIEIFKLLEIPIRVLAISSGDLGDLKHIQVDLEAWSPRKKEYFELGSCSNLTDAQARKLNIRANYRGEKFFPHTLNNTAIATSRAIVAIMENLQQENGSIKIPNALIPYMKGKKEIS